MIAHGSGYVRGTHPRAPAMAREHIRYLVYRSGAPEGRPIFGASHDIVSREAAQAQILEHSSRNVAFHKIILSPSEEERQGIGDWRTWTRNVMGDFSKRKEMELTWFAVYHDNTNDPHIHVVLAGRGEQSDGTLTPLYLKPDDFRALENLGRDRSEVEMLRQAREIMIDQDRLETESLGLTPPNSNYLRGTSGQATQGAGEPVDSWRTEKAHIPVAQMVRSFARTIEEIDRE